MSVRPNHTLLGVEHFCSNVAVQPKGEERERRRSLFVFDVGL
jgi:hypothetical protein